VYIYGGGAVASAHPEVPPLPPRPGQPRRPQPASNPQAFSSAAAAMTDCDAFALDVAQRTFSRLGPASGATCPQARAWHSMSQDEATGDLFVFGGINTRGEVLGDLWRFNMSGSSWHLLWAPSFDATGPTPRYDHATAFLGMTSMPW
jgi:hypothetical protein